MYMELEKHIIYWSPWCQEELISITILPIILKGKSGRFEVYMAIFIVHSAPFGASKPIRLHRNLTVWPMSIFVISIYTEGL